jgi:hypothetical protein
VIRRSLLLRPSLLEKKLHPVAKKREYRLTKEPYSPRLIISTGETDMTQTEREILDQTKAQCDAANAARVPTSGTMNAWAMPASWAALDAPRDAVAVLYLNLDMVDNPTNSLRIFW